MFEVKVYSVGITKSLQMKTYEEENFEITKNFENYLEVYNFIKSNRLNSFKTLFLIVEEQISRKEVLQILDLLYENKINSVLVTKDDKVNFKLQEKMCKTVVIKENESLRYSLKKIFIVINRDIEKIINDEKDVKLRLNPISTDKKHKIIIGIGASSGGTETSANIYRQFPKETPPMLMVQHMPKIFSKLFTERLNNECAFKVVEAIDGEIVRQNTLYVAPGGYQMSIIDSGQYYKIKIEDIGPVSNHNPSVNYLFNSMANVLRERCIGILLTGMGEDGAEGMCKIKDNDGFTIGQDKESSIVYGMPRVAFEKGGVCIQLSDKEIPNYLMSKYFRH